MLRWNQISKIYIFLNYLPSHTHTQLSLIFHPNGHTRTWVTPADTLGREQETFGRTIGSHYISSWKSNVWYSVHAGDLNLSTYADHYTWEQMQDTTELE